MIVASDASDDDTDDVVLRIAEQEPRVPDPTRRFGFLRPLQHRQSGSKVGHHCLHPP